MFHILFAALARVFGPSLPLLRLFNVIISYGCSVLALHLFRRELAHDRTTSFLAALAFTLSPYFFSISFILLTDNLATLFTLAALIPLTRLLEERRRDWTTAHWESFAFGAAWTAAALLVRQLCAWVLVLMAVIAASGAAPLRSKAARFAVIGMVALPVGVLFLLWGGANPPTFHQYNHLNPGALTFLMSCVGFYSLPFLIGRSAAVQAGERRGMMPVLAIAVGCALLLNCLFPLTYCAGPPQCNLPADGFLWRMASHLPQLLGSDALFYALAAFGAAQLVLAWRDQGPRSAALWIFFAYAPFCIANAGTYQKYFDLPALIVCLLANVDFARRAPRPARAALAALCLGFVAYAIGAPLLASMR